MPKLWEDTIEAHRRGVRIAILDAAAALVAQHGLLSVTMSQIAEKAGIGRATLYKYFPDVESILVAWHERQVMDHLDRLVGLEGASASPAARLASVLEAYALLRYGPREGRNPEIAALVHRAENVQRVESHLSDFVRDLVVKAVDAGEIRDDVAAEELTSYCLHSLCAAATLRSPEAVRRLVDVTMTGLRAECGRGAQDA